METKGAAAVLVRIRAYMALHRISKTQFGMLAVNSPSLVDRLENGNSPRVTTIHRIDQVLAFPPPARFLPRSRATRLATRARARAEENLQIAAAATQARTDDPFEQAKRHLQQRGFPVFSATVIDPADTARTYVGQRPLFADELVRMAERYGFKPGAPACAPLPPAAQPCAAAAR